MNDTGTPNKFYDVHTLGIEETDSCPVCKRQLKALVEEYDGGTLQGKGGEWICLACGVIFIPKSRLGKMIEAFKQEQNRIIKPALVVPGIRS
jgi:rubrerythrin